MILFNYFVLSCFGSINLLAGSSQTNPTQVLPSEQHAFLKKTAENIGRALDELGEDELVTLKTQKIYNIAEYIPRNFDEETQLKKISNRIAKKIESVLVPLRQTSIEIYDFMMNIPEKLQFDQACVMKVKILIDPNLPVFVSARHLNLTKVFKQNYNRNPSIKFQYFIPSADYGEMTHVYEPAAIDECYKSDDPSYQNTYLRTIEKKPKRIILMIDVGSSLSMNQLDTAKRVARHIISSLSDVDRVGLIAVNANVTTIFNDFCKQNTMVQATSGSKRLMMKFIDFLGISRAATNHTIGFQIAFSLLNGTWLHGDGEDATIVYVSKGLLSPLNELKPLLNVIAQGQQTVSPRVVINTCLLVDDEKPLLFDKILREVAEQNFTKHNISFDVSRKNMSFTGVMESVSSDTNVDSIVRRLITSNYSKNVDEFTFSLPKWDGNSLTMSVSTKIKLNTGLLGVIGLDVYLEDITEDIVYYHQNSRSYAFLIDTNGHVMMHPYLKQSRYSDVQASDKSTVVIDIKNFELDDGFDAVKNEMLMSPKGSVKVERQSSKGRKKIQYAWQKVYNLPFIVVVVSDLSKKPLGVYNSNTTIQGSNLVHHLYYLVNSKPLHPRNKTDEQNICSYMNQLTFFNASSLFLSAWVFQSPFRYLSAPESNVRTYSAYLNDVTKPFADHGFRDDGIQYDILALMRVLEEWEKNILKSKLSKYVVRKYVATSSGLLVVFPGSVIEHNLDPVRRSWFSRAVKNPEKIILSSPYLDAGWAGYIVTYSQKLVYHLKASSVTPTSVVMAMDLTLGYFYTLLLDNLPFCTLNDIRNIASEGKIKCFLMDDKGYILSHPNSLESSKLKKSKIPNEGLHITHKSYPLVASDILNHEGFVKKLLCTDYSTNTIQRYYKFNTSLTDVLINKISGEQCVRYQIVSIPGTNVFLGVVNTTCQPTAFCPCSTLDRQCMNCNRMAQTDCECPCECSLDVDVCLSYNHSKGSNHSHQKPTPPCPNYAEPFTPGYKPSYYYSLLAKVKPCTNYECKRFTNYKDCMGTAGCEWCTTDQDGVTPLRNPECTVQAICFNGIRNSYFPYGNIIGQGYGSWMNADTGSTSNSMLMILVLFAIIFSLGLMSYCYVNRTQMNQIDSAQQLSLYTADKRYKKFSEEPSTDHNNVLLQSGMQEVVQDAATAAAAAASQSPYSSNSSSRLVTVCAPRRNPAPTPPPPPRPPRSESDDHGYSTMASTTNDDAFTSFFSPSPSPPHHHLATTAVLLSPHQFCVPVIVHRVQDNQ